MNKEKELIILTSFLSIGIIVVSGLASFLHLMVVIPVTILGFVLFILILLQNQPKIVNITEKIEKIVFFITLLVIAISFIVLYKPI